MTKILDSALLIRLNKYRIQSKRQKRGFQQGARRSMKQGQSLDFSDYRQYQPGDDLRQIDWNIYARTNKHYIKRFLDEQELVISLYLDCSKSMNLIDEKWLLAKRLAATLGYMSLSHDDRVGIFPVCSTDSPFFYKKGRAYANKAAFYISELTNSVSEQTTFSQSIANNIVPKSGVSIIISDFLEPLDDITAALKKIQANRQELYVIQLLTEEETNPNYQGDLKLIDSEMNQQMNVSMLPSIKRNYVDRVNQHTEDLEQFCFDRGIGFIRCSTNETIEEIIFESLMPKGWIV
ncbi:DUF58 domain-containing protein [Cytobacillus sp. IB215316]|uniref:DUF58 domain-containing protein n=1 Tax=Cytobacillus sp. IB215316 TaxID=3097354 RepID=UPI002A0FDF52|nr:DUF58 domain-containing protein [Cytobacillus sp. IB215316]MDX8361811.1 DUF58 domain-containing protein [Cytobacillus sp. IB215316]